MSTGRHGAAERLIIVGFMDCRAAGDTSLADGGGVIRRLVVAGFSGWGEGGGRVALPKLHLQ